MSQLVRLMLYNWKEIKITVDQENFTSRKFREITASGVLLQEIFANFWLESADICEHANISCYTVSGRVCTVSYK